VHVDGEVSEHLVGASVDTAVGEPPILGHPVRPLVGAQVVEQRAGCVLAAHDVEAVAVEQRRLVVREQEHVGAHLRLRHLGRAEDAERHPRVVGRDLDVDGDAVAAAEALLHGRRRVELRGHEVRRTLRVEVEDLGHVTREVEPLLVRPLRHGLAAAAEDRHVERVDTHLLEHLDRAVPRQGGGEASTLQDDGVHLALESLQRPVAGAFDLRRLAGERDDRAEGLRCAGELEARDVVLDTVVIRGERRGAHKVHRAVVGDEAPARAGRGTSHDHDE